MNIFVVTLHIIVCFVLIVVILLQAGRGQGLSGSSFGGGNVQSLFGTKASSFLTKVTSVCAILFLFTCVGLNILEVQKSRSLFKAPGTQAPLDVEQIKKALEKVKQADKTATEAQGVAKATSEAEEVAETAKADVAKMVESAAQEAATAGAAKS